MNSSYEFISMSPNEATLSVNAIIPQTTTEVMGTSMDIGGNQTGTLTIDPLTGLLKSMNIEQTTQLGVAGSSETITEANIKITRDN